MGEVDGSSPKGRAIWIAARNSAASSRSGAACAASRPARSTHTLAGPLIMISLTSESSRALSKPGRKRFEMFQSARGAHIWPASFALQ